jgi:hypothetical protein
MAKQVKPLDPSEATLELDPEMLAFFGKGTARTRQIEGFDCHPGRQSRRTSFVIYLSRAGSREIHKHPIALRLSSRDARRLGRMFTQMADTAEGIG